MLKAVNASQHGGLGLFTRLMGSKFSMLTPRCGVLRVKMHKIKPVPKDSV